MRVIILNLVRLVLEDSSISSFLLFIGVSLQLGVQFECATNYLTKEVNYPNRASSGGVINDLLCAICRRFLQLVAGDKKAGKQPPPSFLRPFLRFPRERVSPPSAPQFLRRPSGLVWLILPRNTKNHHCGI